jgi:hypothetical protein
MTKSIVYRLQFSDEDESVLRELISIGFKAIDICQQESLKIPYKKFLEEIVLLAIETVGAIYQNPHGELSEEEAQGYLDVLDSSDYGKVIKCAFKIYQLAHYPPSYKKLLMGLQAVISLGSVAVIRAYPRVDLNHYASLLHKSQTLNRDLFEAIHGVRNPLGLNF